MSQKFDHHAYTRDLRENWNAAAPHYGRMSADYFPPIAKAFTEFAGLKPGQSVLDVACGPGTATALAAKAVGKSGKVVGVDLSAEMLKIAGMFLGSVDLREMNAEDLDFPDGTFDAVLCQLGLMLFARPEAALGEMIRVAKPRGTVACLVQGRPEKMLFSSLLMKTMVRHAPEIKKPGVPNLYAFGGEGMLEWALRAGDLQNVREKRLEGTFPFDSVEAYWELMVSGAGRTGSMLKTLAPAVREAVKRDVFEQAQALVRDGRLEMPFEFVMAAGVKA